jgi:multiple sugar transport system permease protein
MSDAIIFAFAFLAAVIIQWILTRVSRKTGAIFGPIGTSVVLLVGINIYSHTGVVPFLNESISLSWGEFIFASLVWYLFDIYLILNLPDVRKLPIFGNFGRWYRHRRDAIIAWTFLTPMVIYFTFFTFVPLLLLIGISFTSWNLISPPKWVGLQNLIKIFSDNRSFFYLQVFGRTTLYAIAILILLVVGGFAIAMLLNQQIKLKGVYRTLWYLPGVFSGAVIVLLLRIYLANSSQGILNMVLYNFGMTTPIDWQSSTFWMPVIAVLFPVWQGIGGVTIFFLAGLQGVDENLYDAAKIDGANGRQLLRYITIPQMVPILLFISVTTGIGAMQMWEIPRIMTAGGPNLTTYTLVWSIQHDAFDNLEMGLGTAQSLVLFLVLLGLIGWQLNNYRKIYGV